MKQTLAILAFTIALIYGCKKDDSGTSVQPPAANYFPFAVGRSWTYNTTGTLPNGQPDPGSSHALIARVFQMNQFIGGQPNATIIQATAENNQTSNLVFYAEPAKLWAYFPASDIFGSFWPSLLFSPGAQYSATVGLNQSLKVKIYDWGGSGSTFEIRRQPNGNFARATLIVPDSLKLEGVSLGATSMAIGKAGSPDSMTVLINVANTAQGFGPGHTPWMPMWESSFSTTDRDLYTWDSTFSFRKKNGTILRDHVIYHVTGHFVQNESVSVAGETISSEKHALQMSLAETIDSISGGTTYPIFSGLSYEMTGHLWVAGGTGLIKGDISGSATHSSHSFYTAISGYVDSQGILNGVFASPRMTYYSLDVGSFYVEYFHADAQPPVPTGSNSFVLTAKNF